MQVIRSSETSAHIWTTRRYIPKIGVSIIDSKRIIFKILVLIIGERQTSSQLVYLLCKEGFVNVGFSHKRDKELVERAMKTCITPLLVCAELDLQSTTSTGRRVQARNVGKSIREYIVACRGPLVGNDGETTI
jgi:hypothetical protein